METMPINKNELLAQIQEIAERKQNLIDVVKNIQQQISDMENTRAELIQDYFDILLEEEYDQDYINKYDFIDELDIAPDRKTRRDVMTAVDSIKAKKSSKYYKMRPRNPRADRTKSLEKKSASKNMKKLRC